MMFDGLIVLIPALNEEVEIENVILGVREYGIPLLIDDGSTDRTSSIAKAVGAVVISHPENRGYEKALETGFEYFKNSHSDYLITLDADNQHDPEMIREFYSRLIKGSDCVVGIRDKFQRIGEKIFGSVSRVLWGIEDPLCGMKAYSRQCFDLEIDKKFDSIGTKYVINAVKHGADLSQIRIITRERSDHPRFGSGLIPNFRILRALFITLFFLK